MDRQELDSYLKIVAVIIILLIAAVLILKVCILVDKNTKSGLIDPGIEYASTEGIEEIINEMLAQIEKEEQFKLAYLNNSTKVSTEDIKALGNVIYNEARGCSKLEQSCVAWTVLNRCDKDNLSVIEVVSKPKQFAYKPKMKLRSEKALKLLEQCEALAKDVLIRHLCEKDGLEDVGRTLPNNYYSFWGDGIHNHFRTDIKSHTYWDYSLRNPYV